jgi:hypothetical protein
MTVPFSGDSIYGLGKRGDCVLRRPNAIALAARVAELKVSNYADSGVRTVVLQRERIDTIRLFLALSRAQASYLS